MKNRKVLSTLVIATTHLFFISPTFSQEKPFKKHVELGMQIDLFNGIHQAAVVIKKGVKESRFLKWRVGHQSYSSYADGLPQSSTRIGTLAFGLENRMRISKNAYFFGGPELFLKGQLTNDHNPNDDQRSKVLTPGCGISGGILLLGSDKWHIFFETIPSFQYGLALEDHSDDGRHDRAGGFTMDFQGFFVGVVVRNFLQED